MINQISILDQLGIISSCVEIIHCASINIVSYVYLSVYFRILDLENSKS